MTILHPSPRHAVTGAAAPGVAARGVAAREAAEEALEHRATAERLNWLRAGVLGANDGVVSVAAVVIGVAAATSHGAAIAAAGLAALAGGALSMALGEYVSVSSARDAQTSAIARLGVAAAADAGVASDDVVNPWHAGLASAAAFVAGAALPLVAIIAIPWPGKIAWTFGVVLLALAATGWIAARLGDAPPGRAMVRVVLGGAVALALTFGIGTLFGVAVG